MNRTSYFYQFTLIRLPLSDYIEIEDKVGHATLHKTKIMARLHMASPSLSINRGLQGIPGMQSPLSHALSFLSILES